MNRTVKKTARHSCTACILVAISLFGLGALLASCSSDEVASGEKPTIETEDDTNLTTFETGTPESKKAPRRTSFNYNDGAFYWEAGDKIYVKDDDNVWQVSKNSPTEKTTSFQFKVPGKFTASTAYQVCYPGKNGSKTSVTILAEQTQTLPNDTKHFGVSGDNGIAEATLQGSSYKFWIDHKATYLVFQPYASEDAQVRGGKLIKIEVTSDKNIAGTFTLNPTTKKLEGTGNSKQIVLKTTGSGGAGFSLNTTSASVGTNGAYMVLAPGEHKLKIRYWVKLADGTEGTIIQTLQKFDYKPNHYYDIKKDLKIPQTLYYMWDASKDYWNGVSNQPVKHLANNTNYPKGSSDPRYYNSVTAPRNQATAASKSDSFKNLPNVNELTWYATKGDPHWDGDKLWRTYNNQIYKGGVWLKKASVIAKENNVTLQRMKDIASDLTTDARKTALPASNKFTNQFKNEQLAADKQTDYFFLPAMGFYNDGTFYFIGTTALYWSSTAYPNGKGASAYSFSCNNGRLTIMESSRNYGIPVTVFQ